MKRVIFAAICVALFLTSVFAGVLGKWAVVLVIVLFVAAAIALYLQLNRRMTLPEREALARRLNPILGFFMRTELRWLICMLVMTVLLFALALNTEMGAPVVRTVAREDSEKGAATRFSETDQRFMNLYREGKFATDAELNIAKTASDKKSWDPWKLRWGIALLFLLLTVAYFFVGLGDAISNAWRKAQRRVTQQTEVNPGGTRLRDFFARFLPGQQPTLAPATPAPAVAIPPVVAVAPAAAAGTTTNVPPPVGTSPKWTMGSWFLVELMAELGAKGTAEALEAAVKAILRK